MTPSESLVFDLCRKSFLSLWSYANPLRPDGRELCDALVVFGEKIIVFSVKEILLNEQIDPDLAAKRWTRSAVDKSIAQLLGAARQLGTMAQVIRSDGSPGVALATLAMRRIHLIAVAAGGKRAVPFTGGRESEREYVHVLEEEALRAILGELDTTADFLHYLEAKESFRGSIICEGEENLLGIYLRGGRKLPAEIDTLWVDSTIWSGISSEPEFIARKREDHVSYWWDERIERLIADTEVDSELSESATDSERVVRAMASENRFARRILSTNCLSWLVRRKAGARNFVSPSGVGYVFGTFPSDWSRKRRTSELFARCLVARSPSFFGCSKVVGLATELYDPRGYSMDVVYLDMPVWTEEDERSAAQARELFGIMAEPQVSRLHIDEFPRLNGPRSRAERNRAKRDRRSRRRS